MKWQPRREIGQVSGLDRLPEALSRLLFARGFETPEQVDQLLNPSLQSLRDPLLLKGMDSAIDRLLKARHDQEKVAIYADFDMDGTSGLALLLKAFRDFGFLNLIIYQPLRLSEGYGFHPAAVEKLAAEGVRVIVTVDVGTTALEAAERASELGMDLIITDHHLPKKELPKAYALINPNSGQCASQLGHLSGAGVAFYLAMALKRALVEARLLDRNYDLKSLLDVFVIGTLTDMVPLVHENRALVRHGLLQLEKTSRVGLRHLMDRLDLCGRPLRSQDVAIQLAPKLNALSRLELELKPRDVLLVEDSREAEQLVGKIIESNELRKNLQKDVLEKARLSVRGDQRSVFVWSPEYHKGVVGLIATQLAKERGGIAMVGYLDPHGMIHGSARVHENSSQNLIEIFEKRASLFERFGGHASAAGFVIHQDSAPIFENDLAQLLEPDQVPTLIYDTEVELGQINSAFMSWYERLEPFGKDFPSALLRVNAMRIQKVGELRGGHRRYTLRCGASEAEGVHFQPPQNQHFEPGMLVDGLVEPSWNYFRGTRKLQLQIKTLKENENSL